MPTGLRALRVWTPRNRHEWKKPLRSRLKCQPRLDATIDYLSSLCAALVATWIADSSANLDRAHKRPRGFRRWQLPAQPMVRNLRRPTSEPAQSVALARRLFADATTWRILIVTTIGIGLSFTHLSRISGSQELAMALLYLFVAPHSARGRAQARRESSRSVYDCVSARLDLHSRRFLPAGGEALSHRYSHGRDCQRGQYWRRRHGLDRGLLPPTQLIARRHPHGHHRVRDRHVLRLSYWPALPIRDVSRRRP